MPALTKDRATPYREGVEMDYPVAANTKIYAGSLVCVNATGHAVPAADIGRYHFAGVAMDQVDNSSGGEGEQSVRLRRAGVFAFDAIGLRQEYVGTLTWVLDDHTFTSLLNDVKYAVRCGLLVKYVSATQGWIDIARNA